MGHVTYGQNYIPCLKICFKFKLWVHKHASSIHYSTLRLCVDCQSLMYKVQIHKFQDYHAFILILHQTSIHDIWMRLDISGACKGSLEMRLAWIRQVFQKVLVGSQDASTSRARCNQQEILDKCAENFSLSLKYPHISVCKWLVKLEEVLLLLWVLFSTPFFFFRSSATLL